MILQVQYRRSETDEIEHKRGLHCPALGPLFAHAAPKRPIRRTTQRKQRQQRVLVVPHRQARGPFGHGCGLVVCRPQPHDRVGGDERRQVLRGWAVVLLAAHPVSVYLFLGR